MNTGSSNVRSSQITAPQSYNPDAFTPEEHFMNLKFQLVQVDFWLSTSTELEHARGNAAAKSRCLLEAAEKLVAAFRKEMEGSS